MPALRLTLGHRVTTHPVLRFIDARLFPSVVTLLTSRSHIIFLLSLVLVVENPYVGLTVALAAGNWTNIISASASAIVLRQQSAQHDVVVGHHESHGVSLEAIAEQITDLSAAMIVMQRGLQDEMGSTRELMKMALDWQRLVEKREE